MYADTTGEVDTLSTYNYSDPAFYDPNYFEDELEVLPQIERYKTSFNNNDLLVNNILKKIPYIKN